MKTGRFKDLLFQILNENDTSIDDIETDDENNFFLIRCIDHTNFVLQIHKAVPHFMIKEPPSQQTSFETYIQNSTKKDYLCGLDMLAQDNPFVFLILVILLKLSELQILSEKDAQDLMAQVQPHAQELKAQWEEHIRPLQ